MCLVHVQAILLCADVSCTRAGNPYHFNPVIQRGRGTPLLDELMRDRTRRWMETAAQVVIQSDSEDEVRYVSCVCHGCCICVLHRLTHIGNIQTWISRPPQETSGKKVTWKSLPISGQQDTQLDVETFFRHDSHPAEAYADGCTYVHTLSKRAKRDVLQHPFKCSEEQVHFGDMQLQGLGEADLSLSKRKAADPVYRTNEEAREPYQRKRRRGDLDL
jgi:hypothetical protein